MATATIKTPKSPHYFRENPRIDQTKTFVVKRNGDYAHKYAKCYFDILWVVDETVYLDVISMSEAWLKNNRLLLQHGNIPGYCNAFHSRDEIKGDGIEVYAKETIKFKRRTDIENRYSKIEHYGLSVQAEIKIVKCYWAPYIARRVKCIFLSG